MTGAPAERPRAVAFDVLETLLDLAPMRDRLAEAGQPGSLLRPWFLRVQRDAMALALSGESASFRTVARQALRSESGQGIAEEGIDHVLEGFGTVPAHPDAAPAMRLLAEAGVRIGCLTVGDADTTARFLEHAGLAPYVERVVTAQGTGAWKPEPAVYHAAADALGVPPRRMALVAVHAWDCHGAKRAGCAAGWSARLEGSYGEVFAPPDVTGDDLVQVAAGLLELPAPTLPA